MQFYCISWEFRVCHIKILKEHFFLCKNRKIRIRLYEPQKLKEIRIYHKGLKRFNSSSVWIPAMRETQRIVSEIPWTNDSFTMALTYINWETDAIVGIELLQNVGIAIICIFITTLITLGSWRGSLFVMMCVLLTCVDIAGFMHWWGITIEITSMNIVIIR